ncbi:hypothetical protein GGI1_13369 [Acidithiobacillus sp. GGI-221]|nr:hypothetical protein GGI1_13369 [Acidithiobacillus sp. GGI-221]
MLRAMPGVALPDGIVGTERTLTDGETLIVRGGFRLLKRTRTGDQMPETDEAMQG